MSNYCKCSLLKCFFFVVRLSQHLALLVKEEGVEKKMSLELFQIF